MSKKKPKNKPRSNYEIYRTMRKDWGEINLSLLINKLAQANFFYLDVKHLIIKGG